MNRTASAHRVLAVFCVEETKKSYSEFKEGVGHRPFFQKPQSKQNTMGLDYTDGCVNFRDAGEVLNLIAEQDVFPLGRIFRGGSTDYLKSKNEIADPQTIINLRKGTDVQTFDTAYFHFPISNNYEKYDTDQREVRQWLNSIVKTFEDPTLEYPVFVHCLSGKDRTGIVIAALFKIAEIPMEWIVEEYLWSEGEVKEERIAMAMAGMQNLKTYFNRVDLNLVRRNILHTA